MSPTTQRSLLLIFAHPDDESFGCAGAIADCKARGGRVALVCATRGEAGKRGNPPLCAPEETGALRERELRDAIGVLGVDELTLLDYRDKELSAAPPAAMRDALVTQIRRHRPQVVITFDPLGLTAHADHVAISRFALDAVTVAADGRWLPDAGAAHRVGRIVWPAPLLPWEIRGPEHAAAAPGTDAMLEIGRFRDLKAAALRAHRSQLENIEPRFFAPTTPWALRLELFRLGWGTPFPSAPAGDLFEGLD